MIIRKQEHELTIDDMRNFPVWEFAYGENDDFIKFKPSLDVPPYDIHKKRYLIRATFTFANSKKRIGYIKPIDAQNEKIGHIPIVDLAASIVTKNGQVDFWYGQYKPTWFVLARNYWRLGCNSKIVFPVSVKGDVEIINGIDEGVFEGFYYCIHNEVEDYFHMKMTELRKVN